MVAILMFSNKMKAYPIYFFLDIIALMPLLFCLSIMASYIKEDRHVRRACLPIACGILIVMTGAFCFQTVCMLIKYKSLTDRSDKKAGFDTS